MKGAPRIFLLTKSNFIIADQKSGQIKSNIPVMDITSVSVSKQTDGLFAVHLKEVRASWLDVHYPNV